MGIEKPERWLEESSVDCLDFVDFVELGSRDAERRLVVSVFVSAGDATAVAVDAAVAFVVGVSLEEVVVVVVVVVVAAALPNLLKNFEAMMYQSGVVWGIETEIMKECCYRFSQSSYKLARKTKGNEARKAGSITPKQLRHLTPLSSSIGFYHNLVSDRLITCCAS